MQLVRTVRWNAKGRVHKELLSYEWNERSEVMDEIKEALKKSLAYAECGRFGESQRWGDLVVRKLESGLRQARQRYLQQTKEIAQGTNGSFIVIRIDPLSNQLTDRINLTSWSDAVHKFAECLLIERQGCIWRIICPNGTIGAEAEF